jgi:hypothetical protein
MLQVYEENKKTTMITARETLEANEPISTHLSLTHGDCENIYIRSVPGLKISSFLRLSQNHRQLLLIPLPAELSKPPLPIYCILYTAKNNTNFC